MKKLENTNSNRNAIKKQRGDWGNISPVTKIIPNKKRTRKKNTREGDMKNNVL